MPPIARGDDKVLVAVRVRPLNDAERANGGGEAWSVASGADNTITVISHGGSRSAHGTGTTSEVRMRARARALFFLSLSVVSSCASTTRGVRWHNVMNSIIMTSDVGGTKR